MRAFLSKLLRFRLFRILLLSIFFVVIGAFLNLLVIRANGNMMPVATMPSQILFVIGPTDQESEVSWDGPTNNWHRGMTDADRLTYLSDRILLIPTETSTMPVFLCEKIRLWESCPFSLTPRFASIGDLLVCIGILIYVIGIPLVLLGGVIRMIVLVFRRTTRT